MPKIGWTSSVPFRADQIVYLIVDDLGGRGSATEIERADLETLISDLMAGQFNDPVRILAVNTVEHWSNDISRAVADEIQARCDIDAVPVPEHIRDFVENHTCPVPVGFSGARARFVAAFPRYCKSPTAVD